jgi:hypothetical protein
VFTPIDGEPMQVLGSGLPNACLWGWASDPRAQSLNRWNSTLVSSIWCEADKSQLCGLTASDRNELAGTIDRFLTAACLDDEKVILAACY